MNSTDLDGVVLLAFAFGSAVELRVTEAQFKGASALESNIGETQHLIPGISMINNIKQRCRLQFTSRWPPVGMFRIRIRTELKYLVVRVVSEFVEVHRCSCVVQETTWESHMHIDRHTLLNVITKILAEKLITT